MATLKSITKHAGIAGQVAYTVVVQYEGEPDSTATFSGSVYGSPGPVVMITESGAQSFVSNPKRFGSTFGKQWVESFCKGLA